MEEDISQVMESDKSTVEIMDVVRDFLEGGLFWILIAWVAAQQVVIYLVEGLWSHLPRALGTIGSHVIAVIIQTTVVGWNGLVQHAPVVFDFLVKNSLKMARRGGHVCLYSLLPGIVQGSQKAIGDVITRLPELSQKTVRGLGWLVAMVTKCLFEISTSVIHNVRVWLIQGQDFMSSSLLPRLRSFFGDINWPQIFSSVRHFFHYCMTRCQTYCPVLYTVLRHTWSYLIQPVGSIFLIILVDVYVLIRKLWQATIRTLNSGRERLSRFSEWAKEKTYWCCQSDHVVMVKATIATLVPQKFRICMLACLRYLRQALGYPSVKLPPAMSNWFLHPRCTLRWAFFAVLAFVAFTFVISSYLFSSDMVTALRSSKSSKDEIDDSRKLQSTNLIRMSEQRLKTQKEKDMRHSDKTNDKDENISSQISDVVGLMARMNSRNQTTRPIRQKKVLLRQIRMLRDAMVSEKTMLPELKKPPACVGNLTDGEVEDILCIPQPKYLSHIKNPCWYSKEVSGKESEVKLNCLPYFHILGCAKSGTTDLWNRLMSHPHIVSNDGLLHKESLFWSWRRYGFSGYKRRAVQTFSNYIDLFVDTSRQIQASIDKESLIHQILITGDASPPDFWDFRGWVNISQNRNLNEAHVVTPHLMRHFYKNPKFILMFRDPVDRLYTDYFFVGGGLTSLDFHNDVLATIDILARCLHTRTLQQCFHDHNVYVKLPVRLTFACYSLYMREWLRVFPLENFLFIKTEEYQKNPEDTLRSVMEFLGLGPLKDTRLEEIAEEERSRVTEQRHIAGPMKNVTKELLHQLLDPCNKELSRLIKMDKFTWS